MSEKRVAPTHLYRWLDKPDGFCFYCGTLAGSVDHVPPLSWSHLYIGVEGIVFEFVSSCAECNSLAGSKFHRDKLERKSFIHFKMLTRYKKLLAMPDWGDDELEEMQGLLKKQIKASLRKKKVVTQRIAFLGSSTQPRPLG